MSLSDPPTPLALSSKPDESGKIFKISAFSQSDGLNAAAVSTPTPRSCRAVAP